MFSRLPFRLATTFLLIGFLLLTILKNASAQFLLADSTIKDHRSLSGFLGVPWGANQLAVLDSFEKRNDGASFLKRNKDTIVYLKGRFGDFLYSAAILCFTKDSFYDGYVYLYGGDDDSILSIYKKVFSEIVVKHGLPELPTWLMADPRTIENSGGEKHLLDLAKNGGHTYTTAQWWFKPKVHGVYDHIELGLNGVPNVPGGYVYVEYCCGHLSEEVYHEHNPQKGDY